MKTKFSIILLFILLTTVVNGTYYSNIDYCANRVNYEEFIAECPHDHRDDTNWNYNKHYLVNESISYCINGILIQPNCTYELLPWFHPKVSGSGFQHQDQNDLVPQGVPEFGPFGLCMIAISGICVFTFMRRRQ